MLPLRGAPPLTDPAAVAARERINATLERLLARGRAAGAVRADVNAIDIIACGAMITQPLPHGPRWLVIARRHLYLFVRGIRAQADEPLPGPAVTRQQIEAMFAADVAAAHTNRNKAPRQKDGDDAIETGGQAPVGYRW